METAFTRLLGIEHPIIQAPIGALANPRLAAAVSNAGGLGMLTLGGTERDRPVDRRGGRGDVAPARAGPQSHRAGRRH
jgi:nitronate monooxygenase